REHQRLVRDRAGELAAIERRAVGRAEAELLLQHPLGRNLLHRVDPERQLEVQPRLGDAVDAAEALQDRLLLRLHREERRENTNCDDGGRKAYEQIRLLRRTRAGRASAVRAVALAA